MNAPDLLTYFTNPRKENFLRNDKKNAVENSYRKFSMEILGSFENAGPGYWCCYLTVLSLANVCAVPTDSERSLVMTRLS